MTRKKTNEEFIQEVRELVGDEYTFLEPYRGKAAKIRVQHKPCGHTYPVTPNSFLSGGNRCPYCTQNTSKRQSDFIRDVQEKHGGRYTVLGKYRNARTPIKVRCNVCGEIWTPFPNKLLEGTGCPICGTEQSTEKRTKKTKALLLKLNSKLVMNTPFWNHILTKALKLGFAITLAAIRILLAQVTFYRVRATAPTALLMR